MTLSQAQSVRRIQASFGWIPVNLGELWEYRELFHFFVWRDLKVRYKQTVLGALWAIIQPLGAMIVFSIIFGKLAKIPSDGVAYPVFNFAALLPWNLFASGIGAASMSLVTSAYIIRKVFFPRIILPTSGIFVGVVDFAIAFMLLLCMAFGFGIAASPRILLVPLFVLMALASALGVGLWLAAINVYYRDVRHIVPFLTQIWMFASPVTYSSSLIPEPWRPLYALNPMAGVIEGFRWAVLGTSSASPGMILISCTVATVMLVTGTFVFCRMERAFADVI